MENQNVVVFDPWPTGHLIRHMCSSPPV